MVVDVVLPAVLGLVLVRKASVEAWTANQLYGPLSRQWQAASMDKESSAEAAGSLAGARREAYRLRCHVSTSVSTIG